MRDSETIYRAVSLLHHTQEYIRKMRPLEAFIEVNQIASFYRKLVAARLGGRLADDGVTEGRVKGCLRWLAQNGDDTGVLSFDKSSGGVIYRIPASCPSSPSPEFQRELDAWALERRVVREMRNYEDPWPFLFHKWAKETPDTSRNFQTAKVVYDSLVEGGYRSLLRKTDISGWKELQQVLLQFGNQIDGFESRSLFLELSEFKFNPSEEEEILVLLDPDAEFSEEEDPEEGTNPPESEAETSERTDTPPSKKPRKKRLPKKDRYSELRKGLRLSMFATFKRRETNQSGTVYMTRTQANYIQNLLQREDYRYKSIKQREER